MSDVNSPQWWKERFKAFGQLAAGFAGGETLEQFLQRGEVVGERLKPALESIAPIGHLVDFGCGWGRMTPFLAQFCEHYTGVDLLDEHVDMARKLYREDVPNAEFAYMKDVWAIPRADCLVTVTVLQHCTRPRALVEAVWRMWGMQPKHFLFYELCRVPRPHKSEFIQALRRRTYHRYFPPYEWSFLGHWPDVVGRERLGLYHGARKEKLSVEEIA